MTYNIMQVSNKWATTSNNFDFKWSQPANKKPLFLTLATVGVATGWLILLVSIWQSPHEEGKGRAIKYEVNFLNNILFSRVIIFLTKFH